MISKNDYNKKNKAKKSNKAIIIIVSTILILIAAIITVNFLKKPQQVSSSSIQSSSELSSDSSSSSSSQEEKSVVKTTKTVPVLMYHSIATEAGNILRVPKEKFDEQMKWLVDNGYSTITLDEAYTAVSEKEEIPEKSVVITFDDGYIDNYQNALPILQKYNLTGTVFMITDRIDDEANGYLTASQLKEMDSSAIKVESHTVDHEDLDSLSFDKQLEELKNSKQTLEELLNKEINFIAYPTGKYNDDTIKAAKEAGYKMCFKMNGGQGTIEDNLYEFPRFFVGEDMDEFKERIEGTFNYTK